ncbi:MAG TPA: hypothetical protein VK139_06325 [Microbacteriaceae bacterium]|nr:hypothetical protein [Microbacteriaceae bacterium]
MLSCASLVGITSVVTLAAWATPTSYVRSDVKTGLLAGVESYTKSGTWSDTGTVALAGTMTVGLASGVTSLAPGDSAYIPFGLRTKVNTTVSVPVKFTSSISPAATTGITYEMYTVASYGCSASTSALTNVVPRGTSVGGTDAVGSVTLGAATAAVPGTPLYFCIKVTASPEIEDLVVPTVYWTAVAGW